MPNSHPTPPPETQAPDNPSAPVPALAPARCAWLSVGDASALLGVSARAVQKRAERGTLPARRVQHGRALRWEIDASIVPLDGREPGASGSQAVRKMDAKRSQDGRELDAQNANSERESVRKMDARRSQDGREHQSEPDALTARLLAQLETENAFLRATVEQLHRDGAETRAALRAALKLTGDASAPQLRAKPDEEAAVTAKPQAAGDASAPQRTASGLTGAASIGRSGVVASNGGHPASDQRHSAPETPQRATATAKDAGAALTYGDIADALERELKAQGVNPG